MIGAFLGAIQFLTVIPVHAPTSPPGKAAAFFPLIGASIGVIAAVILGQTRGYLPVGLAALLALVFLIVATGGLHEDGFADCADALRAGRSRDRMLAIMKDSRIGAHGSLALTLSTLIRWQALGTLAMDPIPALAAAHGLSRAAAVTLVWITPPAGSGLAAAMSNTMNTPIAIFAILQGVLLAAWCGGRVASLLLAGAALIVLLAHRYFMRRIGGVTGDCLGATAHIVELYCIVVYTCRTCIS